MTIWHSYVRAEKRLSQFLQKKAPRLLCFAYALIYLWYGILKVAGISPVEELVERATSWIFTHEFVVTLGIWEICIGLFLICPRLRRWGLWLLFLQFPGTFMPLITNPEDCFTLIPFGLTLEGQYIFKNLILFSGGLVLIGTLHPQPEKEHVT